MPESIFVHWKDSSSVIEKWNVWPSYLVRRKKFLQTPPGRIVTMVGRLTVWGELFHRRSISKGQTRWNGQLPHRYISGLKWNPFGRKRSRTDSHHLSSSLPAQKFLKTPFQVLERRNGCRHNKMAASFAGHWEPPLLWWTTDEQLSRAGRGLLPQLLLWQRCGVKCPSGEKAVGETGLLWR